MRTNIEIDDKLMAEAMKASGAKTKREAVEKGLDLIVRQPGTHPPAARQASLGGRSGRHENRLTLVDSGVWIDFFRGVTTHATDTLNERLRHNGVVGGDLIIAEVLRGF